jgi:hypothetical protein
MKFADELYSILRNEQAAILVELENFQNAIVERIDKSNT